MSSPTRATRTTNTSCQEQFFRRRPQIQAKGSIKHQGYAGPLSNTFVSLLQNRLTVKWQHRNVPSFTQRMPSGHIKATCLHRWRLLGGDSQHLAVAVASTQPKHLWPLGSTAATFKSLGVRNSAGGGTCVSYRNLGPTKLHARLWVQIGIGTISLSVCTPNKRMSSETHYFAFILWVCHRLYSNMPQSKPSSGH